MGFELAVFDQQLDADFLEWLVDVQAATIQQHFGRLWDYYTNPLVRLVGGGAAERKVNESGRGYVQAQECGLPARITGLARSAQAGVFGARALNDVQRKEVVIENDIAWRINAGADFLFGKPINLISRAAEGRKREEIEAILKALFAANGGPGFFQDMAVLGSVYGFVDCFLRPGDPLTTRSSSGFPNAMNRVWGPLLRRFVTSVLLRAATGTSNRSGTDRGTESTACSGGG